MISREDLDRAWDAVVVECRANGRDIVGEAAEAMRTQWERSLMLYGQAYVDVEVGEIFDATRMRACDRWVATSITDASTESQPKTKLPQAFDASLHARGETLETVIRMCEWPRAVVGAWA